MNKNDEDVNLLSKIPSQTVWCSIFNKTTLPTSSSDARELTGKFSMSIWHLLYFLQLSFTFANSSNCVLNTILSSYVNAYLMLISTNLH